MYLSKTEYIKDENGKNVLAEKIQDESGDEVWDVSSCEYNGSLIFAELDATKSRTEFQPQWFIDATNSSQNRHIVPINNEKGYQTFITVNEKATYKTGADLPDDFINAEWQAVNHGGPNFAPSFQFNHIAGGNWPWTKLPITVGNENQWHLFKVAPAGNWYAVPSICSRKGNKTPPPNSTPTGTPTQTRSVDSSLPASGTPTPTSTQTPTVTPPKTAECYYAIVLPCEGLKVYDSSTTSERVATAQEALTILGQRAVTFRRGGDSSSVPFNETLVISEIVVGLL